MSENEAWEMILHKTFDPVAQAELVLRVANHHACRTDPWRWYCRICGAEGHASDADTQRRAAMAHLDSGSHPRHPTLATFAAGRLLHVWTY